MCISWYALITQDVHTGLCFWKATQKLVVAVASGQGHAGEEPVSLRRETDVSQCASLNWNIF